MRSICALMMMAVIATPALGQSEAFNPFQASLDHMPLIEAQPAIEAAYGPIADRSSGLGDIKDKSTLVLMVRTSPNPSYFIFCHDRMAGFSAPVTPRLAGEIIDAQTGFDKTPPDVYGMPDGVTVSLMDRALSLNYMAVGTPQSRVEATYPLQVFVQFNMSELCASLAD